MASDVWSARHRSTFRDLKRDGVVVRASPLAAVVLRGQPDQPLRLAFAVPTTVGSAVVRNRLRRQVRARIAHHAAALRGHVILVRITPKAALVGSAMLTKSADRLMSAVAMLPSRSVGAFERPADA